MPFVHLHLHSECSSMDGLCHIPNLIKKIKSNDQKYAAITDHGVTNGWPIFYKEAKKNDIVPILGIEGYMCDDMHKHGIDEEIRIRVKRGLKGSDAKAVIKEYEEKNGITKKAHIVILAKNIIGQQEILKATSDANEYGFYIKPRFDFGRICEMKNVVITTACTGGIVGYHYKRKEFDKIDKVLSDYKNAFGDDFYIELQAIDWDEQSEYNYYIAKKAIENKIKMIVTNDCHYIDQADERVHDCLLAIRDSHRGKVVLINDENRFRYSMQDLYIKNESEMVSSFNNRNPKLMKILHHCMKNTIEIAEKCSEGSINKGFKIMPVLNINNKKNPTSDDEYDHLVDMVNIGWDKKIKNKIPASLIQQYNDRLAEELEQIKKQGFVKYFIIVQRLMEYCRVTGIERGPARGSSASSLVCYLLDITKSTDPIKYKLLFSRFIDPNRTDNPDIDMDFQDDRRDEVIKYLEAAYGKYNVAMLSNNVRFKGKGTLRDVSRVFNVPQTDVNGVTELIIERSSADSRASFTLQDSFNEFDKCKLFKEKYPKVVEYSGKLEGNIKCISGNAKVFTLHKSNNSKCRTIDSLYKRISGGFVKPRIRIWDGTRFIYKKVKNVYYNGKKDVYKVRAGEYEINCTYDHRFLTKDGWKEICSIRIGEDVACNGKFVKYQVPWNKGKKLHYNVWNKGFDKHTDDTILNQAKMMLGNDNYKYRKIGLNDESCSTWRKRVFESLPSECCNCGCKNMDDLIAHHIVPRGYRSQGDHSINNAMIVCKKCHAILHNVGCYKHKIRKVIKWSKLEYFEYLGEEDVYDIEIDTNLDEERNFVANGFIVHNCYSRHAAGVIIGDGDLRKYVSIRWDKDLKHDRTIKIANIDKRDIDDLGLLKLDVLGLNTLTIMAETKRLIKENHNLDIDFEDIEPDDPKVFAEFAKGNTIGIFQLDSLGLIRLSQQIKISNFDELMAASALHRPGPLHGGQAARYPAKKFGHKVTLDTDTEKQADEADDDVIKEITKETYGEILYQEQIMMIVRELGGFDWKDTNDIRKCMSKSGGAEYFYRNYWDKFRDGCAKHKIGEVKADKIFRRINTFGCISYDSKITVSENKSYGNFPNEITIKELYNMKEKYKYILGHRTNAKGVYKIKFIKIDTVWYKGLKDVYEISLKSGNKIKGTKDHIFRTLDGFIKLSYMKSNHKIAVRYDLNCKICGCKCYNKIGLFRHLSVKHNIKASEYWEKYFGRPKCKCGCGKYTKWSENGEFSNYVSGHQIFDKNPMYMDEKYRWNKGKTWKDDNRILHGSKCYRFGKEPSPTAGRTKWYKYKSYLHDKSIMVQGTYELRACEILDRMGIYWERNKDHLIYCDDDGNERSYTPDFKIYKNNAFKYLEIKGWFPEDQRKKMIKCIEKYNLDIEIWMKCDLEKYEKMYFSKYPDVYFDEIEKIEYVGKEETYDISVVGEPYDYFVNNICVHNSWAFNAAHACSYSIISYNTMWSKVYYPHEYLTAYLNKTTDKDSVPRIVKEIKRLGIKLEEPDINVSKMQFRIANGKIYCNLSNIKHVGDKAIAGIIDNQPYNNIVDFIVKNKGNRAISIRVVRSLIDAGCFRSIHPNNKSLVENIDKISKYIRSGKIDKAEQLLNDVNLSGERYSEEEEIKNKTAVSPLSIGKHIVEFYRPFCNDNFGKHIKIVSLDEFVMDVLVNSKAQRYNLGKIYPYCLGLLRSVDLKRFSQEVKYVAASEDEFRYAICDYQDETDYCMLSLRANTYKKYEKMLWESIGKVMLIKGLVVWGAKKIYVSDMWDMDKVMNSFKDGTYKESIKTRFLFENPFFRLPMEKIQKLKDKYDCVDSNDFNTLRKNKKNNKHKIMGIVTGINAAILIRRNDSKYKGKYIIIYEMVDGNNIFNFTLYPWNPSYGEFIKTFKVHIQKRYPLILNLGFLEISGSSDENATHLRQAAFEIPAFDNIKQVMTQLVKSN